MPVNQDGVEVNPDGTQVTDEQRETSDWSQVIELHQKSNVKPYDISILATNTVPINIPYLEVYRTDELYYKDYESPFSSTSEQVTDGINSGDDTETTDGTGTDTSSQTSSGGSKVNDKGKQSSSSGKVKTQNIKSEILRIVKIYYKSSANYNAITNRYMLCKNDKKFIAGVTALHQKHLKKKDTAPSVVRAILNAKKKYG